MVCSLKYETLYFNNRTVLVFATERKNNVDPLLRLQKKVNNIQLFFTKLTGVHLGPVAMLILKLRSFLVKHGCYGVQRKPMVTRCNYLLEAGSVAPP